MSENLDVPSILRGWPARARRKAGPPLTILREFYDVATARARLSRGAAQARPLAAALKAAETQVGYRRVRVRDDELPWFVVDERERLRRREVQSVEDKSREKGEPKEREPFDPDKPTSSDTERETTTETETTEKTTETEKPADDKGE